MLSIHYVWIMMRFLYRLATALGMRANHEYWCKCTWPTNGINKTATSETDLTSVSQLTVGLPVTSDRYWACFQVTRLFLSATIYFAATYVFVVWNFTGLITRLKIFFTSIWWGSIQLQCIFYLHRILISRPPRVFRRFKRRSFLIVWYFWIVHIHYPLHLPVRYSFFNHQ